MNPTLVEDRRQSELHLSSLRGREFTHDDQENEFVRAPIIETKIFILASRCIHCKYVILAGSAYELLDLEEQHARECNVRAASTPLENRSA